MLLICVCEEKITKEERNMIDSRLIFFVINNITVFYNVRLSLSLYFSE